MLPDQSVSSSIKKPIVLSIHGIRTTGGWQKSITPVLTEAGFVHYPYDYGFFFALQMLFPFLRNRRVEAFREFYESVPGKDTGIPISLIAHSFGTYIAAKTMEKYVQVSFDQIIFCGSIVPREYDWATIIARGQARRVLHDYGGKDMWVRVAEWAVTDAGPSGQAGFIDPPAEHLIQQAHPNFRHSDHFYPSNFKQRWIPFLRGRALPTIPLVRPARFNWKPWVLALIILILGFASLVWLSPPAVVGPPPAIDPALVGHWESVGRSPPYEVQLRFVFTAAGNFSRRYFTDYDGVIEAEQGKVKMTDSKTTLSSEGSYAFNGTDTLTLTLHGGDSTVSVFTRVGKSDYPRDILVGTWKASVSLQGVNWDWTIEIGRERNYHSHFEARDDGPFVAANGQWQMTSNWWPTPIVGTYRALAQGALQLDIWPFGAITLQRSQ